MTTLAELRQANLKEQKKTDAADLKAGDLAATLNGSAPQPASLPLHEPVQETAKPYLERVRESLSSRTMHPIGSKVTTDMSPALFNRAKRFCAAHGNITLRQLFLDLLTNFLEEEGY